MADIVRIISELSTSCLWVVVVLMLAGTLALFLAFKFKLIYPGSVYEATASDRDFYRDRTYRLYDKALEAKVIASAAVGKLEGET